MITGIVVPVDPNLPLRQVQLEADHLPAFQAVVGGNIEPIRLYQPSGTMYVNEEGKNLALLLNHRATAIASLHNRWFRGVDLVVGDALIVGPLDERSLDTDVPRRLIELWFEASTFRVEKKVTGAERWDASRQTFDDVFIAYVYANRLAMREPDIDEVRVVPVAGGGPPS